MNRSNSSAYCYWSDDPLTTPENAETRLGNRRPIIDSILRPDLPIQADMLSVEDPLWMATPIPGRRLSIIEPERRAKLTGLVQQFGLEPTGTIWPRLNRALIHRSHRAEAGLDEDNERLEFLGDSVIGLSCTEYILRLFPESDEGALSKLRASLVSRAILGHIARDLGVGNLLLLGTGEEKSGGRERLSILGSTLEAICGVLYLHYSWSDLRAPLRNTVILPAISLANQNIIVDHKSRLQELTQRTEQRVPEYRVTSEQGPDHDKDFIVEVWLGDRMLGTGAGKRKKGAENEAARQALENWEAGDD
jgi:ribonuclease-3